MVKDEAEPSVDDDFADEEEDDVDDETAALGAELFRTDNIDTVLLTKATLLLPLTWALKSKSSPSSSSTT